MNDVLVRIRQIQGDFTKTEKKVASSVLKEPGAVATRSIADYADYTGSSTATVNRFCKKIGLSGYPELKLLLSRDLTTGDVGRIPRPVDMAALTDSGEIGKAVLANTIASVQQLGSLIQKEKIDTAASLIAGSRHVMLTGVGASALVAHDMHQKLVRIGILSHWDEDFDIQKVQLASFDSRDAVIAFSYSGEKKQVYEIVRLAKSKGARIIAVTKLGNTPISLLSDVYLPVAPSEALVREGASVSRIQMLVVVDVLFQVLIARRGKSGYRTLYETWNNVSGTAPEEGGQA